MTLLILYNVENEKKESPFSQSRIIWVPDWKKAEDPIFNRVLPFFILGLFLVAHFDSLKGQRVRHDLLRGHKYLINKGNNMKEDL